MKITRHGEGRPLVLLPGNDLPAAFYASLGDALADRGFAVHVFTLPGYEGTPALEGHSWPALVDHAAATAAPILGGDGVLVGHSLGGLLALVLAARLQPARLVLMEPAIVPYQALVRLSAWLYRRSAVDDDRSEVKLQGPGFSRVARPETFPDAMLEAVRDSRLSTDVDAARALVMSAESLYPLPYAEVRCPALLVRGVHSGWVIDWGIRRLSRQLDAQVVDVDAAHWLANEADAAIAHAIADFA